MQKFILIALMGIFNLTGYAIKEALAEKYKMFEPEIKYGREIQFETKEEKYMSLDGKFTLYIFRIDKNTPSFNAKIARNIHYKYRKKSYRLENTESIYDIIIDENDDKTIFIKPFQNSSTIFQLYLSKKVSLNKIQEIENYLSIILNEFDYKIVKETINIFW